MSTVENYIKALSNLYGRVSVEQVLTIYNEQNHELVSREDILACANSNDELNYQYNHFKGEFFEGNAGGVGMPFYLPEKEELLKYVEDSYVERSESFDKLVDFIHGDLGMDEERSIKVAKDIQLMIVEVEASSSLVIEDLFECVEFDLKFKNVEQIEMIISLFENLVNNTRFNSNNGYTNQELVNSYGNGKLIHFEKSYTLFPAFK